MKVLIFILLPFFASAQFAQFKTADESAVVNYEVQDSINKKWHTISTVQPTRLDTNFYQIPLPGASIYVRIKQNMISATFYTKILYLYALPEAVINPKNSILNL